MAQDQASALGHLRVLELGGGAAAYCGHFLADLGADVIKIEPPGGDPGRRIGPFYHDIPESERSLYWFAYNINKRGVTLDLETADGQALFKRLASKADFVIESFQPGYMNEIGLGYDVLSALNPRLVMTSLTLCGQTGPRSHYKPSDIVASAFGGSMYPTGDPDRAPVQISFPQAYLQGAEEATIGALIAHYHRQRTGEGQYVDASIQEALGWNAMNMPHFWEFNKVKLKRVGIHRSWSSASAQRHRVIWPCKDGYVSFTIYGGKTGAPTNRGIVDWMASEMEVPEWLKTMDWDNLSIGVFTEKQFDEFAEPAAAFFKAHTVEELHMGALTRDMMLYPVFTVADISKDDQLDSRRYWQEVEHPELNDTLTYPGPFIKLSETPLQFQRRPPLIGEHNLEIYEGELGLTRDEMGILKQSGAI